MIRKDPALDSERAHYYSEFWIEVAAGRPIGQSAQAPVEEDEEIEPTDFEDLLSAPPMPAPRIEPRPKPRPAEKKDAGRSLSSLADLANIADLMSRSEQMEDDAVPDIAASPAGQATPEVVTNFDIDELPEEEEPEVVAEEDEEPFEEEEEDDEWGGSRRPKPSKPPRRDRRGF